LALKQLRGIGILTWFSYSYFTLFIGGEVYEETKVNYLILFIIIYAPSIILFNYFILFMIMID